VHIKGEKNLTFSMRIAVSEAVFMPKKYKINTKNFDIYTCLTTTIFCIIMNGRHNILRTLCAWKKFVGEVE